MGGNPFFMGFLACGNLDRQRGWYYDNRIIKQVGDRMLFHLEVYLKTSIFQSLASNFESSLSQTPLDDT